MLDLDPEIMKKVQELQILQQNLQNLVMEEQLLRQNLIELEDAIQELESSNGKTFKLVGEVFIEKNKEDLINELNSKKEILEVKLESIEKHKEKIRDKLAKLQEELSKNLPSDLPSEKSNSEAK